MAYERHEWECGETITADLLNNLEGGVEEALECCESSGGGTEPLIIRMTSATQSRADFDKTWQEVKDALANGQRVLVISDNEYSVGQLLIISATIAVDSQSGGTLDGQVFGLTVNMRNLTVDIFTFNADSADGYLYMTV